MFLYLNNFIWKKIVLMGLEGRCMSNTTGNCEFMVLIIIISIKVVKIGILGNIMVNIVPMNIKISIRFKF